MGLLDVLNGMQNGPRGQKSPAPNNSASGGGMSPILMAVLGLLAYKALSGSGRAAANPAAPSPGRPNPGAPNIDANAGGGLGGLLGGTLGGLLAGGAAGSILSGGLGDLLKQFQQTGHEEVAKSWVSNGPNRDIAPNELANALGSDRIQTLVAQTGMSRDDLLAVLSENLPEAINQMTPDGRVPTEQELIRRL